MFGLDLDDIVLRRLKSGRWFRARLSYLLMNDTALARYFQPRPE